jgi:hypothetical protein
MEESVMADKQLVYPKTRALVANSNGTMVEVWYATYIDTRELHLMAKKARKNKSGSSKDGPVTVMLINGGRG